MLQLYFSTRCKSLLRLFRRLGIFSVVILLLILFLFLLITREAPGYYTLLLYLSIGLTWHLSRADKAFLQTYFSRKFVLLYMTEYLFLSLPFVGILAVQHQWVWGMLVIVLSILLSLLPKRPISLQIPTFPFLCYGSYEYQRMGRIFPPFYLVIVAISVIGVYISNANLVLVANFSVASIIGMLLSIKVVDQYLLNYVSLTHFFRLKGIYAFGNGGIIMLPMLLCLFFVHSTWGQLTNCIFCYLNSALFFLQLSLLRLICSKNELLMLIVYFVLVFIFMLSTVVPVLTILSSLITGVLAFKVSSFFKKI